MKKLSRISLTEKLETLDRLSNHQADRVVGGKDFSYTTYDNGRITNYVKADYDNKKNIIKGVETGISCKI